MSVNQTDDFTVSISGNKKSPFVGPVGIGFVTRAAFEPYAFRGSYPGDGMYILRYKTGKLFGSGKASTHYCTGVDCYTLRCVADRVRGTIEFYEDDVYRGVAWTGVPSAPLHACVMFTTSDVYVEFV